MTSTLRPEEEAVDALLDRWESVDRDSDTLDEDFDDDRARKAVRAVLDAWQGGPDEDDGVEHPARMGMFVVALERALDEAHQSYRDEPPRPHPSSSGWEAEAFPAYALGLA